MTVSIKEHSDNVCWFDLRPNDESDFISIYLIKDEKIGLVETGPACSHLASFSARSERSRGKAFARIHDPRPLRCDPPAMR